MIKELALALAVGSGFLANVQAQSGLGLALYVPHNVTTTNTTATTWSGEFKAPLTTTLKGKADWAAFCVDVDETCYVEPSSGITTGNYTFMKEQISFDVQGLDTTANSYWCYVATVLHKGMVCSDPVLVNVTASPSPQSTPPPGRAAEEAVFTSSKPVQQPAIVVTPPAPEPAVEVIKPVQQPAIVVTPPAPEPAPENKGIGVDQIIRDDQVLDDDSIIV